jgi:hypothetical protein
MTRLLWDQVGERRYENGVNRGVLYLRDAVSGAYDEGFAWNGLTAVNETPSGAESNKQYADNMAYLNLKSAEEFGATIEALTYPDEFARCDGTAEPEPGVYIGQQKRETFGFAYRTLIGTDVDEEAGYKLHLVYGCDAAPSEKNYNTVNDSPEATSFSWELTTTPVEVGTIGGTEYRPTSILTIDSTKVSAGDLAALEDLLYGTGATTPQLPDPATVVALFAGTLTEVETQAPTYNSTTDIVTIPAVTGVVYSVDGVEVPSGDYGPITDDVIVTAVPAPGYSFTANSDDDWVINFA